MNNPEIRFSPANQRTYNELASTLTQNRGPRLFCFASGGCASGVLVDSFN